MYCHDYFIVKQPRQYVILGNHLLPLYFITYVTNGSTAKYENWYIQVTTVVIKVCKCNLILT